ncbi:hypothetical protein AU378_03690 [Chryseobacterium kwangjuense]|uniref:Uncharacterized protein n=1 Tax=Chryseobacterium kwangjuense TaxID=267125 RepID=A0A135WIZ2_9FLAO|nr:hypothetical protein AU378_03690 [Chryseobacterium kwangjuense]
MPAAKSRWLLAQKSAAKAVPITLSYASTAFAGYLWDTQYPEMLRRKVLIVFTNLETFILMDVNFQKSVIYHSL